MEKLQRPWPAIAKELSASLSSCKYSAKTLSIKANIDYYAARRMLKNGVKNRNKNSLGLCSYFGISPEVQSIQGKIVSDIKQVLTQVLDGSKDQADLLAAIIWSTRGFKISRDKTLPDDYQGDSDLISGEN